MRRRTLLGSLAAAGTLPLLPRLVPAAEGFSFEQVVERARLLAAAPYRERGDERPPQLAALSWDAYQRIRFRPDHALWADLDVPFRIQYAHLGIFFKKSVRLHEVVGGSERLIDYEPALFDYGGTRFDPPLPHELGFAGFRIHHHTDFEPDVAVFQGASYFRAVDSRNQYGMSARGLAIDTGLDRPEEFPDFTDFWLVRPGPSDTTLRVFALLDGPSVTGAYRFDIAPGDTTLFDVEAVLFFRRSVERLGIAPLTAMYQCGENDRRVCDDWRPEIHDTDGLAIVTGRGERLWRPVGNPTRVRVTTYLDDSPRLFALEQRDRDFGHYLDDGARYHLRPSVWVEPLDAWGPGRVMLVELPTPDETFDNIVAFWNPERPPAAGAEMRLRYRLHWGEQAPLPSPLARVIGTRTGRGGVVGHPEPPRTRKFVVDFAGGKLPLLAAERKPEIEIETSHGYTTAPVLDASPSGPKAGIWRLRGSDVFRVAFDLHWQDPKPVDMRLRLRLGHEVLSETWVYLFDPPGS
ncbi:Glucans biosynthesis protein D [bacterium HR40]|nr:Glucans biosynthesis protein D [bacterium HR40]